ncbi:Do family serine endopeptidase [bacterium]|nr:MAG: Do family serine endopeptidase [bacterium]
MSNSVNNHRARRALQAGAVIAAVGAGYALRDINVVAQNGTETTAPPAQKSPVVQTPATRDAASMQGAFVDVASAVEPAVVTITTSAPKEGAAGAAPGGRGGVPRVRPFGQGQGAPNGAEPFGGDLQEFFKQFQRNFGMNEQSFHSDTWQGRVMREKWNEAKLKFTQEGRGGGGGLGSGMIYRADGLILTNAHVVRGADTVLVTLSDGRKFDKAKVLGRDESTDIAVVKIDATNLPTVKLGDSTDTRVGDWAIAVGNPFGLDHTLTVGVISAKSRQLNLAKDTRTDYLQTDASINPGNSGGPLLDIYGRVIGVNNAIYSESGGNQGIGFAIPVNTARFVADRIVKDGRVRRSYLGVEIRSVEDAETANGLGLPEGTRGVLVNKISNPNAPGARAGLQPGDVITKFNDQAVKTSPELQGLVGNSPIGSQAKLTIVRDGKTQVLTATLEELKDAAPAAPAPAPNAAPEALNGQVSPVPGLKVRNLSPEVARALGIKTVKGLVVTEVKPGSPADEAGLQRGDVIERVAQSPVSNAIEFGTAVDSVLKRQSGTSKKVALYINRGGESSYAFITVE